MGDTLVSEAGDTTHPLDCDKDNMSLQTANSVDHLQRKERIWAGMSWERYSEEKRF